MTEHHIIETEEDLKELDKYLESFEDCPLALDTETEGLFFHARDIGICISVDPECGFYIPSRVWNGTELVDTPIRSKLLPYFQKWFVKPRRHLIMHNAGFDCRVMMINFGLKLINLVQADTRLLFKMTVSEDDPSALKDLGMKYLNENAKDEQKDLEDSVKKNGGKWLKDFKEFFRADMPILAKYGAKDPCLTLQLFNLWYPLLLADTQLKLLWDEETLPLMELVFIMNTTGFPVDLTHFNQIKVEIAKEIDQLEKEIISDLKPLIKDYEEQRIFDKTKIGRNIAAKRIAEAMDFDIKNLTLEQERILKNAVYVEENGQTSIFNLASPKDLKWLIYEKLGEPVTKKTKKGQPSTDQDVIESLAARHEWANKLVNLKQNEKLLSTYVEGALTENVNGLTYFEFDQGATISGRFATRGGIPIMTLPKKDKRIKKGFIAPPGYKIVSADFNSLEPHLAAHLSGDPALIDCFVSGKDFYSVIGIGQFKKIDSTPYKDGTPGSFPVKYSDLRELVKTYALASLYGAEEHRIGEIIHPEALTWKERAKAKAEAKGLLDGYFMAFPKIPQFVNDCHKEACLYGQIRTKFGRIRHMPFAKDIYSKYGNKIKDYQWAKNAGLLKERREFKNLLNNSVNIKVQGLAAHCTNRSMINTKRAFDAEGLDAWVCLQVHDEIVCIARENQADRARQILEKCMADCVDLSPIHLKAEAHIGNNLAEVK